MSVAPFATGGAPIIGRRRQRDPSIILGANTEGFLASAPFLISLLDGLLDPRIAFTAADANRWRRMSNGLLENVGIDVPRFDYGYECLAAPAPAGLLCEPASTNICLHSDDLTNAAWTKTNGTAAKDQVGADGVSNSASSFTATSANATVLQAITQSSAARTFSLYLKRITGTGTVEITHDNGSTWTAVTLTASWRRFHVTQTIANSSVGIRVVTNGDAIGVQFAQDEVLARPTSPIRTAGSTVTRSADVPIISGVDFTEFYTAGPGTLFAEFAIPQAAVGNTRYVLAVNDNGNTEAINIVLNSGDSSVRAQDIDGGVTLANIVNAAPTANVVYRIAMAYNTDDFRAYANGVAGTPDTGGTLPTVTQMRIGSGVSGVQQLSGWIRKIAYWDRALTNNELQMVSA